MKEGPIDLKTLSSWLGVEVEWILHVQEYEFCCGCAIGPDDPEYCDIWQARQDIKRAHEKMDAAQRKLQLAKASRKGTETK
jgi:hypothetical protein